MRRGGEERPQKPEDLRGRLGWANEKKESHQKPESSLHCGIIIHGTRCSIKSIPGTYIIAGTIA